VLSSLDRDLFAVIPCESLALIGLNHEPIIFGDAGRR
jgi:hypothetical protein